MPRRDRINALTAALRRRQVAVFLRAGASYDDITIATEEVMAAENGTATLSTANPKRWFEPEK
jgi:hypothetical protein